MHAPNWRPRNRFPWKRAKWPSPSMSTCSGNWTTTEFFLAQYPHPSCEAAWAVGTDHRSHPSPPLISLSAGDDLPEHVQPDGNQKERKDVFERLLVQP